jgi:hypothetical protein
VGVVRRNLKGAVFENDEEIEEGPAAEISEILCANNRADLDLLANIHVAFTSTRN